MFSPTSLALPAVFLNPPVVVVDRDNVEIDRSCIVEVHAEFIEDADNNGVIHIVADDITVEFASDHRELVQVPSGTAWDTIDGIGIRIDGRKNVTVRGAHVHRFKVGIYATNADGLTLDRCDVAGGFAQRLRSTPEHEDSADWLWPHNNDNDEWLHNYGAGIYVGDSGNVTIRECFARRRQNGIILDHVNDSRVYDNDFSFLSGWGLAMWRSNRNTISRNAFDFCVRGYSHGVYNRGQDSAGILMFEQCSDNLIAENSATHGGDGFFAFAGREALGEVWVDKERERLRIETGEEDVDHLLIYPEELIEFSRARGNNRNILIGNDFSYAVAHGIELTFSFGNQLIANRMVGNAICGIWGGYSQETLIAGNHFEECGDGAYGLERGGVNIEHGRGNRIQDNTFLRNKCGVHVWWDPDDHLMLSPWAKANDPRTAALAANGIRREQRAQPRMLPSTDDFISGNSFTGDTIALHARSSDRVFFVNNTMIEVETAIDSPESNIITEVFYVPEWKIPDVEILGEKRPVGDRAELAGRDKIIITEWGPYDWREPLLQQTVSDDGGHEYRLLGTATLGRVKVSPGARVQQFGGDDTFQRFRIVPAQPDGIVQYELKAETTQGMVTAKGLFVGTEWRVRVFSYETDPRTDLDGWREKSRKDNYMLTMSTLQLNYGNGGPSDLPGVSEKIASAELGANSFGTIAETTMQFPSGRWRIKTTSDDGIRVFMDDEVIIDDWTWHGPTRHDAEFDIAAGREVKIRVEHFELDGWAVLDVSFEQVTNH